MISLQLEKRLFTYLYRNLFEVNNHFKNYRTMKVITKPFLVMHYSDKKY